MSFSWIRVGAVARKEWYHVRRDPFTMAVGLALPLIMVVIYGVAIDFIIKDVSLAVSDSDHSQASRRLIDTFVSSNYFRGRSVPNPASAMTAVVSGDAKAALIIPPTFERDLLAGRSGQAQILLDGCDNSTVTPVLSYLDTIEAIASSKLAGATNDLPYDLRVRYLFNPELNSRWFTIPGLIVVIMAILAVFLTALTVAREWENGSMELLLSTPVHPIEIIIGKAVPYAGMGAIAIAFVYIVARFAFGVPFAGHLWVFALGCALFLVTYQAQGLLISIATRNQAVAMQVAMISGMVPSNLLSGFVFPIASMPRFFWYFTMLLPARWFMTIARFSFLEGSNFSQLGVSFLALGLSCAVMTALAVRAFKRTLE
jgi:ABC-2 type transport system permease protein